MKDQSAVSRLSAGKQAVNLMGWSFSSGCRWMWEFKNITALLWIIRRGGEQRWKAKGRIEKAEELRAQDLCSDLGSIISRMSDLETTLRLVFLTWVTSLIIRTSYRCFNEDEFSYHRRTCFGNWINKNMLVISHKEGRCAFETFSLQIDNGSQSACFSLLSINCASELYHL